MCYVFCRLTSDCTFFRDALMVSISLMSAWLNFCSSFSNSVYKASCFGCGIWDCTLTPLGMGIVGDDCSLCVKETYYSVKALIRTGVDLAVGDCLFASSFT